MLIPLRGKLLVEIISNARKTDSGLFLAENIKEVPHKGVILELGLPWQDDKGRNHAWDCQKGEIVHFKRNWGTDRDKTIILKREDIFAVEGPRALQDYVIIKRVYEGKIGNSTIVIPDGIGIRSNYEDFLGIVIYIGIENKLEISIGDRLCYQRNEGYELKGYKEHWAIKPRAVLGRVV